MKTIKKIKENGLDMSDYGIRQKFGEIIDALNSHLEEHKKDIEELRGQCDIAYKEHLKHIHPEPKQEIDGSKIYPGQVGSGESGENSGLGVGSGYDGSKPKQEYCRCKEPYKIEMLNGRIDCKFCNLPLPTKQECKCKHPIDTTTTHEPDKHYCFECRLPLPTNTKEEGGSSGGGINREDWKVINKDELRKEITEIIEEYTCIFDKDDYYAKPIIQKKCIERLLALLDK
jgi:hypothetical protein